MRWDELFEELEAEFTAATEQEQEGEIPDLVHAEAATVTLVERLRHRMDQPIQVQLRSGERRQGMLKEANHAWLMLHREQRRHLIPIPAIAYAWPLAGAAPRPSGVEARLTLGYALRKLAEAGIGVQILTEGGELQGRLGIVGADYCDVHTLNEVIAVPWAAMICIER